MNKDSIVLFCVSGNMLYNHMRDLHFNEIYSAFPIDVELILILMFSQELVINDSLIVWLFSPTYIRQQLMRYKIKQKLHLFDILKEIQWSNTQNIGSVQVSTMNLQKYIVYQKDSKVFFESE